MKTVLHTEPTYAVRIYLSGPIEVAAQVLREECLREPTCVTLDPTTFIYEGGEETGYVVGMLNYPRFPKQVAEIHMRALSLAKILLERTFQRSALVVGPEETTWITRASEDF